MTIPYDPDFDPPRGLFDGVPSRTAFIFGVVGAIGLGAIITIIMLLIPNP